MSTAALHQFKKKVWEYYRKHRRYLPWRKTRNPYLILVSEVMLQQTQVDRVIDKYKEFITDFPSFTALARAQFDDLIARIGKNKSKVIKNVDNLAAEGFIKKMKQSVMIR